MDFLVANVDHLTFKIESDLNEQNGALPIAFPGMDKSTAAVCLFFNSVNGPECDKDRCPFRHIRADRTIVCKHWLRGLCKKGDQCEFLHEYDMTKMPECYFYSRFNACHNKECPFLHIDPESKIKDCPWYDRGFCRHGPNCRHRHVRRVLCNNYLAGLCPDGSACKFMHPRFELPPAPDNPKDQMAKRPPICHFCGELGHKASFCAKLPPEQREAQMKLDEIKYKQIAMMKQQHHQQPYNHHLQQKLQSQMREQQQQEGENGGPPQSTPPIAPHQPQPPFQTYNPQFPPPPMNSGPGINPGQMHQPRAPRALEEITCFKCGNKGHYANKCPKGHLAFLSSAHTTKPRYQSQQPPYP